MEYDDDHQRHREAAAEQAAAEAAAAAAEAAVIGTRRRGGLPDATNTSSVMGEPQLNVWVLGMEKDCCTHTQTNTFVTYNAIFLNHVYKYAF